jgi:hypothetical protein
MFCGSRGGAAFPLAGWPLLAAADGGAGATGGGPFSLGGCAALCTVGGTEAAAAGDRSGSDWARSEAAQKRASVAQRMVFMIRSEILK